MITRAPFGELDGSPVHLFTLRNENGMGARITNYGGIVVSLNVPDRAGKFADVVLGFDTLEQYVADSPYFGAIIGRFANRIANGRFTLEGKEYFLAQNNGANHLHGGLKGFDKVLWTAEDYEENGSPALSLKYRSKDGEEGYPGNLDVQVIYTLTPQNELRIDYRATTDKTTIINLTNHSYFNLAGAGNGDILSHRLMINAEWFTPVDSGLIPTGELRQVQGTPFDFQTAAAIGQRIGDDDEQLMSAGGYDHNFVINEHESGTLVRAARLEEPLSGRCMEVLTTEPGVQLYSGNFLNGSHVGKGGAVYRHRYGVTLETQHFPDSPNRPTFPSTVLHPGKEFTSTTVYRFSTSK